MCNSDCESADWLDEQAWHMKGVGSEAAGDRAGAPPPTVGSVSAPGAATSLERIDWVVGLEGVQNPFAPWTAVGEGAGGSTPTQTSAAAAARTDL
jgi:hypothetical protein